MTTATAPFARDYSWQERFVDAFIKSNTPNSFLSAVTGSGKSEAKRKAIKAFARLTGSNLSMILVNTTNVTKQHRKSAEVAGFRRVKNESSGQIEIVRNDKGERIVYATWQAVSSLCKKIKAGAANPFTGLGLLIIDEVHNGASGEGHSISLIREVLAPQRCLYVSATLQAVNEEVFGKKEGATFHFGRAEAVAAGLLCDVRLHAVECGLKLDVLVKSGVNINDIDTLEGRSLDKVLEKIKQKGEETLTAETFEELRHGRVAAATDLYFSTHFGQKAIVFCPTVEAAHNGAEYANTLFNDAAQYEGKAFHYARAVDCTKKNPADIIADFIEGDLTVIYVCGMLQEGTDIPHLSLAFDCRFITSTSPAAIGRQIQRLGRVLRAAPGKTCADYYCFVDVGHLLKAETMASETGRDLSNAELASSYLFGLVLSNMDTGGLSQVGFRLRDCQTKTVRVKKEQDLFGDTEEPKTREITVITRVEGYRVIDETILPKNQSQYEKTPADTDDFLLEAAEAFIEGARRGEGPPTSFLADGRTKNPAYDLKTRVMNHDVIGSLFRAQINSIYPRWVQERSQSADRKPTRSKAEIEQALRNINALAKSGAPKPTDPQIKIDITSIADGHFARGVGDEALFSETRALCFARGWCVTKAA